MKIAVVGTGYVGLVTGTCFAEMGNKVWCVDVDEGKISMLQKGEIPIYEPGLKEMVLENCGRGHLHFTTRLEEALAECKGKDSQHIVETINEKVKAFIDGAPQSDDITQLVIRRK